MVLDAAVRGRVLNFFKDIAVHSIVLMAFSVLFELIDIASGSLSDKRRITLPTSV